MNLGLCITCLASTYTNVAQWCIVTQAYSVFALPSLPKLRAIMVQSENWQDFKDTMSRYFDDKYIIAGVEMNMVRMMEGSGIYSVTLIQGNGYCATHSLDALQALQQHKTLPLTW